MTEGTVGHRRRSPSGSPPPPSRPSPSTYATADGTATQPADYAQTSGTLTFTPGQTTKTVNVPVVNDALDEADETFTLVLSGPSNAALGDGSGAATIIDADDPPSMSIGDVTVTEGTGPGTTNAVFTVDAQRAPAGGP